jgi:hypothetical protein
LNAVAFEAPGGIGEVDFLVDDTRVARVSSPSSGSTYTASFDTRAFSDGTHTVTARAVDTQGYTTDVSRTVTIDNTSPTVSSISPANLATGILPGVNVLATFSEAMKSSSTNTSTFKLYAKSSATPLAATVSYDPSRHEAVLDPSVDLSPGTTYKAVITTGVRDLAGNHLVKNEVWTFTTKK